MAKVTRQEAKAEIKKFGLHIEAPEGYTDDWDDDDDDDSTDNFKNSPFYNGAEYAFYGKKKTTTHKQTYGSWTEINYSNSIQINTSSSTYSCGVPEMGQFNVNLTKKSLLQQVPILIACINYVIANEGVSYFRATTTTEKEYEPWNEAFVKAGWEKRAELPSQHASGIYNCIVWEWRDNEKA